MGFLPWRDNSFLSGIVQLPRTIVPRGSALHIRRRHPRAPDSHVAHAALGVERIGVRGPPALREAQAASFEGGFAGPFPPAVAHRPLLKCSYRSDRATRGWPMALRVHGQHRLRRRCGGSICRSVLGSWVGVRRLFHRSLFLSASRVVLPKILVLHRRVLFWLDGPRCHSRCSTFRSTASCTYWSVQTIVIHCGIHSDSCSGSATMQNARRKPCGKTTTHHSGEWMPQ